VTTIDTGGSRQLSFRGIFKNRCERLQICATYNILKLWRAFEDGSRSSRMPPDRRAHVA
jgi:hypothetical protein